MIQFDSLHLRYKFSNHFILRLVFIPNFTVFSDFLKKIRTIAGPYPDLKLIKKRALYK